MRLVAGEAGASLGARSETCIREHIGQASGAVGDVGPREPAVAEDNALPIRNRGGDRFVHLGEVELHWSPKLPKSGQFVQIVPSRGR